MNEAEPRSTNQSPDTRRAWHTRPETQRVCLSARSFRGFGSALRANHTGAQEVWMGCRKGTKGISFPPAGAAWPLLLQPWSRGPCTLRALSRWQDQDPDCNGRDHGEAGLAVVSRRSARQIILAQVTVRSGERRGMGRACRHSDLPSHMTQVGCTPALSPREESQPFTQPLTQGSS